MTDSDGASLAPFGFESDITVYAYYAEDLLEKLQLIGDKAAKPGSDAVYSVRFATANEITELYVTVRFPESVSINEIRLKDAVSVEEIGDVQAAALTADALNGESDGFVTATFKCVLSDEPTSFEETTVPFEIVFAIGEEAKDFSIEILPESHMKGETDYSFSEVFSPEITVKSFVPGDVTGDGEVNKMDALRLKKYLAGLDVEIDLLAADVTGDGEVNKMDALRLKKYLAGLDVKLGE